MGSQLPSRRCRGYAVLTEESQVCRGWRWRVSSPDPIRGELEALTERGPGFVTASVVDPFGNVLGIMYFRHYLDILGNRG
jgi:hypothetical protein